VESRRLYRSDTNKVFAGICGGLGEYFNVDPVILRVVWLFLVVFSGVVPGLIVYIIAIFIIPKRNPRVHVEAEVKEEKPA
jgi:phage shock protein C